MMNSKKYKLGNSDKADNKKYNDNDNGTSNRRNDNIGLLVMNK